MENKTKAPRLLTVSIFTTITIVFWIFYSVYHVLTAEPETEVPDKLLTPMSPELDTQTLQSLQGKIYFEESDVTTFITPTPPEELTPTPTTAQVTPTPEQTETATESATQTSQ